MDNATILETHDPPPRVAWVDALKFLGIFAIYLGHFGDMGGQFYLMSAE